MFLRAAATNPGSPAVGESGHREGEAEAATFAGGDPASGV